MANGRCFRSPIDRITKVRQARETIQDGQCSTDVFGRSIPEVLVVQIGSVGGKHDRRGSEDPCSCNDVIVEYA